MRKKVNPELLALKHKSPLPSIEIDAFDINIHNQDIHRRRHQPLNVEDFGSLGRLGSPKNTALAPIRHTFSPEAQRESTGRSLGIKNFHRAVNHSLVQNGEASRNMGFMATDNS